MKCPKCGSEMAAEEETSEEGDFPIWWCTKCSYTRNRRGHEKKLKTLEIMKAMYIRQHLKSRSQEIADAEVDKS